MFQAFQDGTFSPAFAASLIAAVVAVIGLLTVWRLDGWAARHSAKFTAFAAGVLIATAISLFPDAAAATPYASFFMLGGYLLLYLITFSFRNDNPEAFVWLPVIGIGFHSFIDGLQYGVLFQVDFYTGIAASAGLIAHEFAEGVILFTILRSSGISNKWAFVGGFFGAALTTPAGALLADSQMEHLSSEALGAMMAIAAGALLYVGATHLPMHIRNDTDRRPIIPMLLGVALAFSIQSMHHHGVDDDHDHHHSGQIEEPHH